MVVTLIDRRIVWFLFPGRREVSPRGSLLEGGRVICYVKTRREAEEAKRMLEFTSDDYVVVCSEPGDWIDLSKWTLVFDYMVNVKGFSKKAKARKVFENALDEESVEFALRFLGEAVLLGKWPEHLVKKRTRVFQLCETVSTGQKTQALVEWFEIDDPRMVTGLLCKMCARAQGSVTDGSDWAKKVAHQAKERCNMSIKTLKILAENRYPERFQSLAFLVELMGIAK